MRFNNKLDMNDKPFVYKKNEEGDKDSDFKYMVLRFNETAGRKNSEIILP